MSDRDDASERRPWARLENELAINVASDGPPASWAQVPRYWFLIGALALYAVWLALAAAATAKSGWGNCMLDYDKRLSSAGIESPGPGRVVSGEPRLGYLPPGTLCDFTSSDGKRVTLRT